MSVAFKENKLAKFNIEIVKGPHTGLRFDFEKEVISLGRGPENDIILANDPKVSRRHAEIRFRYGEGHFLVNLSKKNYVLINGKNVDSEHLSNGTTILLGDTEIVFQSENSMVAGEMAPVVPAPQKSSLSGLASAVPTPVVVPHAAPAVMPPHLPNYPSPQMPVGSYSGYSNPQHGGAISSPNQGSAFQGNNSRVRFYGIIGVVVIIGYFFFSSSGKKSTKDPNSIRTTNITMQDVAQAEKRAQELLSIKREKYDSVQFRRAQENFVKGFRDFQQGQYARARESFQVVLNLDPENELAKRYFHLSKIKFDELVKFNMIQGNRYREKKNWRMCQSSFSNAMKMLSNRLNDPTYKEASQYFEECRLNSEGRF
jgi:pSer/pThr/pTyr-binding forkhead associated (FHA) protein